MMLKYREFVFIFLGCFLFFGIVEMVKMNAEHRLLKHLINNYEAIGTEARPVEKHNDTLIVNLGMALIRITDLDFEKSILSSNVWMRYSWKDVYMTWDPAEYGGIKMVRIPVKHIWTPDIVVFNSARTEVGLNGWVDHTALAVVSHNGDILWIPPAQIAIVCSRVNGNKAAETEIVCPIKLGSWTYDGVLLNLEFYGKKQGIDLDDYIPSSRYKITRHDGVKNTKYYPCCKEPYPKITYYLGIKTIWG